MNSFPQSNPPQRHRRGLPVWTLMVALVVFIVAAGALATGIWYYQGRQKARLQATIDTFVIEKKKAEVVQAKAIEEERLAAARNRQGEVIAQCQNATNVLGRLLQQTDQTLTQALALKTNDAGRALAPYPDLVTAARRLYETELGKLAPVTEIASRLDSVRRLEQQLKDSIGTKHIPDPAGSATVTTAALWAEQALRQLAEAQNLVSTLTREASVKLGGAAPSTTGLTLEEAIRQAGQEETSARQQLLAAKTAEAKAEAARKEAQIESQRIIQELTAKAERDLAHARAEREKMLADVETARQQLMAELEKQKAQMAIDKLKSDEELRLAKLKAEQEIQAKTAAFELEQARLQAEINRLLAVAKNVPLREKLADPKLRASLAPFITPGHWTPKGFTTEKKPLSLTLLSSQGALEDSGRGLNRLAHIAMAVDDRERPRWNLAGGPLAWYKFEESLNKVKQAQQYLNELGPLMVEDGMLDK